MRLITAMMALFCLVPLSSAANGFPVPDLLEDRVVFSSGKEFRIERYRVIHHDPLEALRAREPVSISQRAFLASGWQRVILIETQRLYEDEIKVLSIFDYRGERCGEPRKYVGEALILQQAGRIFLAQKSAHHVVQESFILNRDGELLSKVSQSPNVFSFDVTPDQKLVGVYSQQLLDSKPIVRLSVVRVDTGKPVGEFDSYAAGEVEITHSGNRYTFKVPEPKPPG